MGVSDWTSVVHINNGLREAEPVALSLAPGKETSFHLKVENHGEPTNLVLHPSGSLCGVLRLKKASHYVVLEEDIPVLAVMPEGRGKIEGEILLTSKGGNIRVPISLSSDPVEDDRPEEFREGFEDPDEEEIVDPSEDQEDYSETADEGDYGDYEAETVDDGADDGTRRIRFSKERDVQSYRASFGRQDGSQNGRQVEADLAYQEQPRSYQEEWRAEPVRDPEVQSRPSYEGYQSEPAAPESNAAEEEYGPADYPSERGGGIFSLGELETMQIIPGLMLIAISALLVLTFYAEKIPEFPGALASSILIVTLIIYGAATLLKA
ncbi:MAG: hypothetical protein HPY61_00945 [Methanotrichaceae archaeon]|nr:hypothetical protein [Methanotrichaceae archaeon]